MRHRAFLCLLQIILSFLPLAAQRMPVHPVFWTAKTAAIVNDSGLTNIGDKAYDELRKWGRYQIVPDPNDADLVFVLTANESYRVITGPSTTVGTITSGGLIWARTDTNTTTIRQGTTYLMVYDNTNGQRVWFARRNWGPGGLIGLVIPMSATRELIKELRDRVR